MDCNRVSRNDPCPCGSGRKYKHCCLPKEVAARQPRPSPTITDPHGKPKKRPEYPIGTVALYGPDDKRTTKIAAGVIKSPNAAPAAIGSRACDLPHRLHHALCLDRSIEERLDRLSEAKHGRDEGTPWSGPSAPASQVWSQQNNLRRNGTQGQLQG